MHELQAVNTAATTELHERHLFIGREAAACYIGLLATPEVVNMEDELRAALVLRANVYIDEMGFLPASARRIDGTESDADDARSRHFGVIENCGDSTRVIGGMRAIIKRDEADKLPIERLFPEAFASEDAPVNAVEASRYISRHENRMRQHAAALGLIRAVVAQAVKHDNQPIYAVVEEPLHRLFEIAGLPLEVIGEPKEIPEYNNTVNVALRFDPNEIMAAAANDHDGKLRITPYFKTVHQNDGLGYYDELFLRPIEQ